MKSVLVTGCNGYIASNLIKNLKGKSNIICVGRSKNSISLYNKDEVIKAVKRCDIIVHLASVLNPFDKEIYKINVLYTKFLVEQAKKFKKRFIYLSTQNVLFGRDSYSNSKRDGEELVKTLKDYVILRPTIVYGNRDTKYISKLIRIIKNFPIIPIVGSGKNRLQPIFIEDLVKIIKECINKKINGTFIIAGESNLSYNDLIKIIIKKLGLKRLRIHFPIFLITPLAYILQNTMKNPPLTTVQLKNLRINKSYDVSNIKKIFKINLTRIDEGLNHIMKNGKN